MVGAVSQDSSGVIDKIKAEIAELGPMAVSRFMDLALLDPEHGYYTTKDPFGTDGDFITAPEISQMFGEMIGLWLAVAWQAMGSPRSVVLAELGPGRGTLMADLLRAAKMVPGFVDACSIWLVEASPRLRARQQDALDGYDIHWAVRMQDLPPGPLLVVANEFFDALPVDQYVHERGAWRRRLIGLGTDGALAFVSGDPAALDIAGTEGDIFEVCPTGTAIATALGQRLARDGGAALIVDYGHGRSGLGDTVQAVRGHRYHPVLEGPGTADITAHVDFQALAEGGVPARAHGPVGQGAFLQALGIAARAGTLAKSQAPEGQAKIQSQMRRLIDPAEMGTLFKVMALAHPALGPLIGFDP